MQEETFPFSGSTYLGPDPRYAVWRATEPVVRVPLRGGEHAWLVTRYEDVVEAANDARLSRAASYEPGAPKFEGLFLPPPGMIASIDPPEHTRLRSLADQALSPRRVEAMRPRIVKLADELIDGWAGRPLPLDLMEHFATPLALTVICELLGAPLSDREQFRTWVRQLAVVEGETGQAEKAQEALGGYIAQLAAKKREQPEDDVLSALAFGGITEHELIVFGWTLLGAGSDTTAGQIGLSVVALLGHYPEQWQRIIEYPEEIPATVEELLRGVNIHRSDTSGLPRIALEDVEIGGRTIPAGDAVFLAFTSANHDESVFPEPTRLDFCRQGNKNMAFGVGIHSCLGAPLARLELAVALQRLTQRVPGLRLAVPAAELSWREGDVNHTLKQLPVTYSPQQVASDRSAAETTAPKSTAAPEQSLAPASEILRRTA